MSHLRQKSGGVVIAIDATCGGIGGNFCEFAAQTKGEITISVENLSRLRNAMTGLTFMVPCRAEWIRCKPGSAAPTMVPADATAAFD